MTADPEVVHYDVDPEQQSGDSARLGGAMEIKAPWRKN